MENKRKKQRSARELEGVIEDLNDELEQANRKITKLEKQNSSRLESAEILQKVFCGLSKQVRRKHCMIRAGKGKSQKADAKQTEYNVQKGCCYLVKGNGGKTKPCGKKASFYCKACSNGTQEGTQGKHWLCTKGLNCARLELCSQLTIHIISIAPGVSNVYEWHYL